MPGELQHEVYRTVVLRKKDAVDASWAAWWRAQARAIHHVATLADPNDKRAGLLLDRELRFADTLEQRSQGAA